jgi:hypothetical protein
MPPALFAFGGFAPAAPSRPIVCLVFALGLVLGIGRCDRRLQQAQVIYERSEPVRGVNRWFVVRDLGASLGRTTYPRLLTWSDENSGR